MRRFIECLVPITTCNLKCSYCYVSQYGWRNKKANFKYSPEVIGKALNKDRLGGVCLISMTGAGETLIPKEMPQIVSLVLKEGHFVNLTTNGTLSRQLDQLLDATKGYHSHLHFSFSLHYLELVRLNLLDTFFENIEKVRKCGCSFLVQINLVDEYIPFWDEIKKICKQNVGAYPQVALTRDERGGDMRIFTNLEESEYIRIGKEMESPLFDFTVKNFNVKRTEYCYAGYWSGTLSLETGILKQCYCNGLGQNIFEDVNQPIIFEPVGRHCNQLYCTNSSHFMSQGIIPELLPLPSYAELRNRDEASWYTPEMKEFLSSQFCDTNELLTAKEVTAYEKKFLKSIKTKNNSWFIQRIINFRYRIKKSLGLIDG